MTLLDTAAAAEELSARAEDILMRGEKATWRRRIEFYVSLTAVTLLIAFTSYWSQKHIESLIGAPLPALVHLDITSEVDNPILCPGDTLKYTVSRDVKDFFTGRAVVVVKNLDSGRQEMSDGVDVIWDANQATLSSNWTLPDMLPATLTKPERAWQAGQYEREIAVASYGSSYKIEPAIVRFRVAGNCAGVEK